MIFNMIAKGKTPTGTLRITDSGTYDVTDYEKASVRVAPTIYKKTVSLGSVQSSLTFSGLDAVGVCFFYVSLITTISNSTTQKFYITDIGGASPNLLSGAIRGHYFATGSSPKLAGANTYTFSTNTAGTSITFKTTATSSSSAPGYFYNGQYQLVYGTY